ncbi:acyltransferase family protein [Streptomyces harbinensis]|uniref:acyltransferase family protein n=1 Tax=Streptomyces harbinensis TaxID=1176198 RepID=UPI00159180C1|nr:acyltransferase family protein [Streptomyces harbinensis]QKV67623.1 acyltransferase family protein [Streptomyces harbinensis]
MDTTRPLTRPTPATPTRPPLEPSAPRRRTAYLDNLRIALIMLVVAHHAAQAYGPADWWYVEDQAGSGALAAFTTLNGTFFMSLFFFVSACFVPASVDRRGSWAYLRGRLHRLGIPFLAGTVTLIPVLLYVYYLVYRDQPALSFPQYYADVFLGLGEEPADWAGPIWPDLQFGHLWFIQNLLVYCLLYLLARRTGEAVRRLRPAASVRTPRIPGHRALVLFTLAVAAATFVLRLWYPLDTWVPVAEFIQTEPARLAQYAAFFAAGILAHRHGWLTAIPARTGYLWLAGGVAGAVVLCAAGGTGAFWYATGGATVPAALWAVYETFLCTALCLGLLTLFRERLNGEGPVLSSLAGSAFTMYIVHLPIVVALQFALAPLDPAPLTAWVVVTAAAISLSFPLAAWLRRLPGFRAVL